MLALPCQEPHSQGSSSTTTSSRELRAPRAARAVTREASPGASSSGWAGAAPAGPRLPALSIVCRRPEALTTPGVSELKTQSPLGPQGPPSQSLHLGAHLFSPIQGTPARTTPRGTASFIPQHALPAGSSHAVSHSDTTQASAATSPSVWPNPFTRCLAAGPLAHPQPLPHSHLCRLPWAREPHIPTPTL